MIAMPLLPFIGIVAFLALASVFLFDWAFGPPRRSRKSEIPPEPEDVSVEKVLPPQNPPPPDPKTAIEGVKAALEQQDAAIRSTIPVTCYTGTNLVNLLS